MSTTIAQLDTYLESFSDFQKTASGRDLGVAAEAARRCLCALRRGRLSHDARRGLALHQRCGHREDCVPAGHARRQDRQQRRRLAPLRSADRRSASWSSSTDTSRRSSRTIGALPQRRRRSASLADAIKTNARMRSKHTSAAISTSQRDAFLALNTAFAQDGAYVHVPKGTVVEQPIHLLFVSTASDTPLMTHPRNLIVAEDESQVAVVEDYVSLRQRRCLLQHRDRTGCRGQRGRLALHDRARRPRRLQHLDAAHPAGKKRRMFPRTPSCWAADWYATTCIRC